MVGIYKIENQINHKKYIGQSSNIKKRWATEKRDAFTVNNKSYNYPISKAIRKYGLNNFTFEVIEECKQELLNERERYWIAYYDSYFSGYNQTLGGDGSFCKTPKENIVGIFNDLLNTDLVHREIAQRWNISTEMVQGINTGRYWFREGMDYPIQNRCKIIQNKKEQGRTKKYCIDCGKEITYKASRCTNCQSKLQRKSERPTREQLKILIRSTPFLQIGKMFNVSDNAIRKWCMAENLPSKVKDIKSYSDEEWEKL